MPIRPPLFRAFPRQSAARTDRDRALNYPTRALYRTGRWRALRAAQLAADPLCAFCARAGRAVSATVCDHVKPHRGDPAAFWAGPFQSLCASCHASAKQRQEG